MDDRTYKDILNQAISLIPHYCPEWTNHNVTDPGITLLELFSWMTEMTIYRLNKVPEKTYLALLDLLGLTLSPPQSARVILRFYPVEGYKDNVRLKKRLQVGTEAKKGKETIIFETEKAISITNFNLVSCYGRHEDKITDNLAELERKGGFKIFNAADEIERKIYLESPIFGFLAEQNVVSLTFDTSYKISSVNDEITNFLSWEYWNGEKWVDIEDHASIHQNKKEDNQVFFQGPLDITEIDVQGKTGFYLRASVKKIPQRARCFEVTNVRTKLIFVGDGLSPDQCLGNVENMIFTPIDLAVDFKLFPDYPKYNDSMYLGSREVLSKKNSRISILFGLSEMNAELNMNRTIQYRFEFWNGRDWVVLGSTSPINPARSFGQYNLNDETKGFTKSGKIAFDCPSDISYCEVNGEENYWIRIRIVAGDLGKGGQFRKNENGTMEWTFDENISSPLFNRLRLSYNANKQPVERLISYDNFAYLDHTSMISKNMSSEEEKKDVSLFTLDPEKFPVVYFGFDKCFPNREGSIFFKIDEKDKILESANYYVRKDYAGKRLKRFLTLNWQYWNGKKYAPMSVNDYTDSFHESGFVEFTLPEDFVSHDDFGKDLFWIRLVFEAGSFETMPVINNILLNSVYGLHQRTYGREILGGSSGLPNQQFEIIRRPILPGLNLVVKEPLMPPEKERLDLEAEEGSDAISLRKNSKAKDEVFVRYHRVDNFLSSKSYSRHYVLDFQNNCIIFGDGVKGCIPPRSKNNIIIEEYCTGGGEIGNIGSGTVRVLRENVPFLAGVENPYPAEGGADLEGVQSLKARAAGIMKSLNRAVTAEDYEWLALEASASVARAKCLSKLTGNGEVRVIIVPRIFGEKDVSLKPFPTQELLRRVKAYLSERKLIGTKLRVEAPVYIDLTITAKVVMRKEILESGYIKEKVQEVVQKNLHPIYGGSNKNGWGFGMPLQKDFIGAVIENIPEIHHVEEIIMKNMKTGFEDDVITPGEDSLIFVKEVLVEERKSVY
ncbi:MAG: putative baseplate assembly protein [Spirochaetales bacterium]|nr:putative baseplate assembly protein [Spirochaetales bacterium]